jgi:epoxyqueuosine reductase
VNSQDRTLSVKERALKLGFDAVGIADLGPNTHGAHFERWLSSGMAGTMTYMHRQAVKRLDPSRILQGGKYAVVVMKNYFTADSPRRSGTGRVAKYARGPDYHETLRTRLQQLADHVKSLRDGPTVARAYVDAGPVPERELAQRAGLGWIGRNSMLIHPRLGSFHFLASVLTDLDLVIDRAFPADHCGSCHRCVESCPTQAIAPDRLVDSRLCISYLTIENTGEIDEALHEGMGDWIFGCDDCQDVCPWNVKFAQPADVESLRLEASRAEEPLDDMIEMTPEMFHQRFGHTPLERAGVEGMRRNARIALRNVERRERRL